ncbi:unnamed protein product [Orchesella dallaii]|uniref:EB domain-containing protein n=1 Tax=Orchesella dallaii TaxID=48710 RepID=A0ABP1RYI3_9HEXA
MRCYGKNQRARRQNSIIRGNRWSFNYTNPHGALLPSPAPPQPVIPSFHGTALYDPNALQESTCIVNHFLQQELDELSSNISNFQAWHKINHHLICDFNKFHKCISSSALFKNYSDDTVQTFLQNSDENILGACRCYHSHFFLMDGDDTCVISAGSDFDCSSTIEYPVTLPWHNGNPPTLQPRCSPGSNCINSTCQCLEGYKLSKTETQTGTTGTCIQISGSHSLISRRHNNLAMFTSILLLFLHITSV